ncbi:nucleoporin Npp106 [Schizosaccharomyces cryophilus OY26]|uniref:Nuclear pore protein n=1 Tax=Schizosaccharomyces cryophilus (strain OY26 / ATCC MYA-4695 / CBS 11777 / NBRC 106824 / NRRL Y48691) TaxID=653667 RepID=S9VTI5_SCHCR|nr:nucleoporin Npp106 [Schizosaccharomyces cryophilus OY26]EPY51188.1 nucleoporin Npp106 [Schizosaccharomyces cryophilus OY26]
MALKEPEKESQNTKNANKLQVSSCMSDLSEKSQHLFGSLLKPQVPVIQYNLNQLEERAKKLELKVVSTRDGDTKAHYLLAESGMNVEQTRQKIYSVHIHSQWDSLEIEKRTLYERPHAKIYKEQNVIASIEGGLQASANDFQIKLMKDSGVAWENRKMSFLQDTGKMLRSKDNTVLGASVTMSLQSSFAKPTLKGSLLAQSHPAHSLRTPASSVLHVADQTSSMLGNEAARSQLSSLSGIPEKVGFFAAAIHKLNDARIHGSIVRVWSLFASASRKIDREYPQLLDAWSLLAYMVDEKSNNVHAFELKTANSSDKTNVNPSFQYNIIHGSLRFLEVQFLAFVDAQLSDNGHVSSTKPLDKMIAFSRLRFFKNNSWVKPTISIADDIPVWAVLFYLMRAGLLDLASEFVSTNAHVFESFGRSFPSYFNAYARNPHQPLPKQLRDRLQAEYAQLMKYAPEDPFKHAIYKLLGQCEPHRISLPEVCITSEDYMWMQLMFCRANANNSLTSDLNQRSVNNFDLQQLQKKIVAFGPRYFNPKNSTPVNYFLALLICGEFERAVNYLYTFYPVEATHYAIAMSYYGLLHTCNYEKNENILIHEADSVRINYPQLIVAYIGYLGSVDTLVYVDYIACISLVSSYKTCCMNLVKILLLQSHDFSKFLGDIREDTERTTGLLDLYLPLVPFDQDSLQALYAEGARNADDDGRYGDSILLYHLLGDYDTVIGVAVKNLSQSILSRGLWMADSQDQSQQKSSPNVVANGAPDVLARSLLEIYEANLEKSAKVSKTNRDMCKLLLRVMDARTLYDKGEWKGVLSEIAKMDILPLDGNMEHVPESLNSLFLRQKAINLLTLPPEITNVVSFLLFMAMSSIKELFNTLHKNPEEAEKGLISNLQFIASNLIMYSTMIEHRLPPQVLEYLQSVQIN